MKKSKTLKIVLLLILLWLCKPFNLVLLGTDNWNKKSEARTDSIVVLKVTPLLGQIKMLSIPRDTYTEIPCEDNKMDKINHAYHYGAIGKEGSEKDKINAGRKCSVKAIEKLLNTKINYSFVYGFMDVINITNILGGVEVVANNTFTQDGQSFKKGETYNIKGDQALAYVRNRHSDSAFKRDERQRAVLAAIERKMLTSKGIAKLPEILLYAKENTSMNINPLRGFSMILPIIITGSNFDTYELVSDEWDGGKNIKGIYYYVPDPEKLDIAKKAFKVYF